MIVDKPDSKLSPGIYLVSVVEARVVQVMADTGSQKNTQVTLTKTVHQATPVYQHIPQEKVEYKNFLKNS